MGVTFGIAEIHSIVNSFMQTLYPFFGNSPADATEENYKRVLVAHYLWAYLTSLVI